MIVYVINSLNVGGAEMALKKLLLNLPPETKVKVITLKSEGRIADELKSLNVDVLCLGMRNIFYFPRAVLKLSKIIKEIKPDIIHSWLYYSDLVASLSGKISGVDHVVWGVRTTELKENSFLTLFIRKVLAFLSYSIPSKIVCVAESAKIKHVKIGYDARKMLVIGNGFVSIDIDRRNGSDIRRSLGISDDSIVIGCVGRFSQDKAQDLFVAAASIISKKYSNVAFLLVGRGNDYSNSKLVSWISHAGLQQKFILLGECNNVPELLSAMDIFCLPSRTEGFPNVLGEAMLHGLPCVSTCCGDAEVILGNTGILSRHIESGSIAMALDNMLSLPLSERKSLGEAAKQRIINNYTIECCVSKYLDLYKELLEGK